MSLHGSIYMCVYFKGLMYYHNFWVEMWYVFVLEPISLSLCVCVCFFLKIKNKKKDSRVIITITNLQ